MAARSRKSAKTAGTAFERAVADHLRDHLDDRIDRRVKAGAKDKGDISGVRDRDGERVVIECKDYAGQLKPAEWLREAEAERANDNAALGVVVAKRRGVSYPGDQYVLLTLDDLIQLLKEGTTP